MTLKTTVLGTLFNTTHPITYDPTSNSLVQNENTHLILPAGCTFSPLPQTEEYILLLPQGFWLNTLTVAGSVFGFICSPGGNVVTLLTVPLSPTAADFVEGYDQSRGPFVLQSEFDFYIRFPGVVTSNDFGVEFDVIGKVGEQKFWAVNVPFPMSRAEVSDAPVRPFAIVNDVRWWNFDMGNDN